MTARTFTTTITPNTSESSIEIPFDPKAVFGKARPPVKVTINGHTFRSTIFAMGGPPFVPLRRSNREAARLAGGETVRVRVELDTEERIVTPPADLVTALKAAPGAWKRWQTLSFTHQREHAEAIEQAKKPETRVRRITKAVEMIQAMPERKRPAARTARR